MAGKYFKPLAWAVVPFIAAAGGVLAQSQPPAPEPQQRVQQENWQHAPSGKMGKEEPSSHAPMTDAAATAAFVNGALAVPGAASETDTVPAKFSQRNAADDKLITFAYTFKNLTAEQRRAIYQSLNNAQATADAAMAEIGTELPPQTDVRAIPPEVSQRVPQTSGYQYFVGKNRVLLVSPPTRIVVGVFSETD